MRTPDDVIGRAKERLAYEVEGLENEIDNYLDRGYLEFTVAGTYSDDAELIVQQKYRDVGWHVMVFVGSKWVFKPLLGQGRG